MVTAAEAERVLGEDKVIDANMDWRFDRNAYRLTADVICRTSGETLTLRGYVGKQNRSFALLYENSPIRKYTVHNYQPHRDPLTGQVFREPHKHYWHDEHKDNVAYVPDDIRIGDPNEEILDFLRECNISVRGSYISQRFFQADQGGR